MKGNLVKHQRVWKYYENDCRSLTVTSHQIAPNVRCFFLSIRLTWKWLWSLKKLRNWISHIICVCSLFCSIRVYKYLHFLPILLENYFFVFLGFFCFLPVMYIIRCNLHELCNICIIIVYGCRCICSHLLEAICKNRYCVIKIWVQLF